MDRNENLSEAIEEGYDLENDQYSDHIPYDEEEGDDLLDNMENDYQEISELD